MNCWLSSSRLDGMEWGFPKRRGHPVRRSLYSVFRLNSLISHPDMLAKFYPKHYHSLNHLTPPWCAQGTSFPCRGIPGSCLAPCTVDLCNSGTD